MIRVLGPRVLVKKAPIADRIRGLWIPEQAKKRPQLGEVVAVGPEVTSVTTGDQVLFGRYSGVDVLIRDLEYVVLWDRDILGVMHENPQGDG